MSITSAADMDKLQSDRKKLELWQNTWQMEFNPKKCFIMCIFKQRNPPFRGYTFCNTTLTYVEKHPYLGVTLDANLRWNHHLDELSSQATQTLNLIKETSGVAMRIPNVSCIRLFFDPNWSMLQ